MTDLPLKSRIAAADRHWWWLTPLVLALLLLPGLGAAGLLDPWEMDRAAVASNMVGSGTVLIAQGDDHLRKALQAQQLPYTLVDAHTADGHDVDVPTAIQQAQAKTLRRVVQAVVVDADGLLAADAKHWKGALANVAAMEAQNRSTLVVLVAERPDAARLRWPLALARAHQLAESFRGSVVHSLFEPETQEIVLAPLFLGVPATVAARELPATLRGGVTSPLWMAGFKQDGATVPAPWLDAALSSLAIRALGRSDLAVRLPGALLAILVGWVLVLTLRRLARPRAGWLGLAVYATLPMTWGLARALTLQATESAGLALFACGLALGVQRVWRPWLALVLAGLALLAGGSGMAGLATACTVAVGAALATGAWLTQLGGGALLAAAATAGLAAVVYGGDPESLLLRGFRFTAWPFGGGPDQVHRDFAWVVGQVGFGLYPWSAIVVLGAGRMLRGDDERPDHQRARAVLLVALVASLVVNAVLIRKYSHFVAPAGPLAALAAALLLDALLAGAVAGRTVAVFALLATLLLHREIGKGAEAVVRFVVFDPPFSSGGGSHPWPAELELPRALRAVALLAVAAFALGAARPAQALRDAVQKLRTPLGAAWALGALGIAWALDGIVSLGTKLDVLLKTLATTWNYPFDRVWVNVLGLRPEVIAGTTAFVLVFLYAVLASVGGTAWNRLTRLPLRLTRPLALPAIALSLSLVAAVAVLLGGVARLAEVHNRPVGSALAVGLQSLAFWIPLLALLKAFALRRWAQPGRWLDPERPDSLLAPLGAGLARAPALVFGLLAAWTLAGIGVGASQQAMTWNWPYFLGYWLLALTTAGVIVATAQQAARGYGYPLATLGATVYATVMGPMAVRYLDETLQAAIRGQERAAALEGFKYIARVLVAAPDTAVLVLLALAVVVNRLALRHGVAERAVAAVTSAVAQLERPRWAATALVLAGTVFTTAYAWSLLPGLSVHYSQKHLLDRIHKLQEAAGGADSGTPVFTHGSAKTGSESNFYTAAMAQIDDRPAVLGLLADRNVAVRLVDRQDGGPAGPLALPGWSAVVDANHDGKRDAAGWFGVASRVDGARVTVTDAKWTPGAWRGAACEGPGDATATVVDNGTDWLQLSNVMDLQPGDSQKGALALEQLHDVRESSHYSATAPQQRFVVVPKDTFSELNHAFREAYGKHIAVVDAASSRLVLLANHLQPGQSDENWLKKSILTQAQFDALPGVKKIFANFDNSIHLVGWKMAEYSVQRSGKYKMTLYWKVVKPTATSWKLFMHPHPLNADRWPLLDPDNSEDENKPCGGCFATNHWMQGDIIADAFEQEVALGTQSGPNDVILGWYNPSSDQRMTVIAASGQGVTKHNDNRVTIGQIQVR